MRALLVPFAAALVISAAARPVADREPSPETWTPYLVRLENAVWNPGSEPVRGVAATMLLPQTTARQRVRWVRLSDHGWTLGRDAQGQWHARSDDRDLGPGEALTFAWLAAIELVDDDRASGSLLAPAERRKVLDCGEILGPTGGSAHALAAEIVRRDPEAPAGVRAVAALDAVRATRYELDGGWRPADEVLATGVGSCSETTFAFVALCRRMGIPARWAGGTVLRAGPAGRPVDTTFHRVAEIHLADRGWVRVETTPGDDRDDARPFGRPPRRMLDLALGGEEGSATGLYYHARNEWTPHADGRRAALRSSRRAFWCAGDPLPGSLAAGEEGLADLERFGPRLPAGRRGRAPTPDPREDVAGRLRELLDAGHPGSLPLVVDALRARPADPELGATLDDRCDPVLAAEARELAAASPASAAAWWSRTARRVTPARDGGLDLAPDVSAAAAR